MSGISETSNSVDVAWKSTQLPEDVPVDPVDLRDPFLTSSRLCHGQLQGISSRLDHIDHYMLLVMNEDNCRKFHLSVLGSTSTASNLDAKIYYLAGDDLAMTPGG